MGNGKQTKFWEDLLKTLNMAKSMYIRGEVEWATIRPIRRGKQQTSDPLEHE